jgi:hypothetical protein
MDAAGRISRSVEEANQKEWKVMNDKFDELAKGLVQSVTRRGALKKFGVGLAGISLAWLGLAPRALGEPRFSCNCTQVSFGCVPNPSDPKYFPGATLFAPTPAQTNTATAVEHGEAGQISP